MIIGIQVPDGGKVEQTADGKVLIIFDEKTTRRDLWTASLGVWLTEGATADDFHSNPALNQKRALVVPRSKRSIKLE